MRRFVSAALAAIAVATAGTAVEAATFAFGGALTGANQSPAVTTPASGYASIVYDDVARTARVRINFAGLTGDTTAAHLHAAAPGMVNGGVVSQLPSYPEFPLGVRAGMMDATYNLTQASSWNPSFVTAHGGIAGAEAAFFAALTEGRGYLNVHTAAFPNGEIRANLAAVPEPATWAMMIGGLAAVGAGLRRRSRLAGA